MASALVSTAWLAAHHGDPKIRIIDATWYMPQAGRDPYPEYLAAHVPGAVFFNVDRIADLSSSLPHATSASHG